MTRRGHLVLEALVAGALALIVLTAVATALAQASRDVSRSRDEVQAQLVAGAALERLASLPATHPAWIAADAGTSDVPGHPGWTRTVAITDVTIGASHFKRAVVTVAQGRSRQVTAETLRWVPTPP